MIFTNRYPYIRACWTRRTKAITEIIKEEQHGFQIPLSCRTDGFVKGRTFLIGDAAGFAEPITAEGISNAIYSGKLIAKAIIESNLESDKVLAKEIIQAILPHSGNSIRIGITGVPGVGKSTFIESFGKYLITKGKRVAILSIDPIIFFDTGGFLYLKPPP